MDDIDILVPKVGRVLPVSRAGTERKLQRIDRYDRTAQVTGFETLTPTGTVRLEFQVTDDEPFDFLPGHFIGIRADIPGVGVRRTPYCIATPPNAEHTFKLLIRLVPEGPLSCYLGALREGDTISFRGPSGRSMLPKEDDTELVLLATGVGVGPYLSLVHHLFDDGFDRPIRLFWGLRLAEDICLVDELDALVRRSDRFSYRISLSQPPPGWTGLRGRVTESAPPLIERLSGKHFYLVGNGAMIEEMGAALSDLGVSIHLIYEERYFNVRYRPEQQVVDQIRARFPTHDLCSPLDVQEAIEGTARRWRDARRR